jgi:ABC-type lipoprotein release transport system permease subunit
MMFLMDALLIGFLGCVVGRLVGLIVIDRPWRKRA